jgi:trans-2-enoyl-CoA reductase
LPRRSWRVMLPAMKPKVRAIVFHEHGDPATVARVEEVVVAAIRPDEARVRMLFAPINPADLNVIEGKYPIRPALPAVPGVEGAGVVEEVGAAVEDLKPGALVLLPHSVGTWREACVVPAAALIVVPPQIAPAQAAMLKINPVTALRMLRDFVDVRPGDWVVQNAANSGVGRAVMQIARSAGIRTVNVVRRAELLAELRSEGDVVLLDEDDLPREIAAATDGAEIRLGLNAVGGDSALRLARALAFGGTIVTYGAMARQPLRVPNGLLIFNDQRWRGFWVTHWYEQASREARDAMFEELFSLVQRGVVRLPVEQTFTLDQAEAALVRAQQNRRAGKILWAFIQ